jgi:hypothetical protein
VPKRTAEKIAAVLLCGVSDLQTPSEPTVTTSTISSTPWNGKLGEGLHKAWWKSRFEEDPATKTTAKLELFALCTDSAVLRRIEATAQQTVQKWLKKHQTVIKGLPEGSQQAYNEVRKLAADPELAPIVYPTTIEEKKAGEGWRKHLYVDESHCIRRSSTSGRRRSSRKNSAKKSWSGGCATRPANPGRCAYPTSWVGSSARSTPTSCSSARIREN